MKIEKYPYQFRLTSGESITVYTENNQEYKFNVIRNDGTALNFSWFEGDVNLSAKKVVYDDEREKVLNAFWQLER